MLIGKMWMLVGSLRMFGYNGRIVLLLVVLYFGKMMIIWFGFVVRSFLRLVSLVFGGGVVLMGVRVCVIVFSSFMWWI